MEAIAHVQNDPQKIWSAVLGELELQMSPANFTTWVKPCRLLAMEDNVWKIGAPNGFSKSRIETKYQPLIEKIISSHLGQPVRIYCEIAATATESPNKGFFANDDIRPAPRMDSLGQAPPYKSADSAHAAPTPLPSNTGSFAGSPRMDGITGPIGSSEAHGTAHASQQTVAWSGSPQNNNGMGTDIRLNPRFRFDNFVVGENNKLAHAAAVAVSENPGESYNPLFLYGGVGLGKTHLMHAIAQTVIDNHPGEEILYVTSEKFTNELIGSIRTSQTEQFRRKYRSVRVLLIDDIQFIGGKETTQEEFFHTFNAIYEAGGQVVLSSDRPPSEIKTLESRLQSRFSAGLIADIQKPNYETRYAILESKAKSRSLSLSPEVLSLIADKVISNIRELEGALNRVVTHCKVHNLPVTKDVVTNILTAYATTQPVKKRLNPEKILEAVVAYYEVSDEAIRGKSRKREYVVPRQVAMFLIRDMAEASLNQIGDLFGGKDHTTVLHACQKVEKALKDDNKLQRDVREITEKL